MIENLEKYIFYISILSLFLSILLFLFLYIKLFLSNVDM